MEGEERKQEACVSRLLRVHAHGTHELTIASVQLGRGERSEDGGWSPGHLLRIESWLSTGGPGQNGARGERRVARGVRGLRGYGVL
eukprot:2609408-Pleurochrysis_carterae.AAC.1